MLKLIDSDGAQLQRIRPIHRSPLIEMEFVYDGVLIVTGGPEEMLGKRKLRVIARLDKILSSSVKVAISTVTFEGA